MKQGTSSRLGWTLTGLFSTFLLLASIAPKLLGAEVASQTLVELGWRGEAALLLGIVELLCLLLYLAPRTEVLGAVLMTGLLGGAMATHLRVGSSLFSHVLFGLYLGVFMWGGLWLRNARLRQLMPLRVLAAAGHEGEGELVDTATR